MIGPGHRVCGHGLAARQLVDGEPDVRRPALMIGVSIWDFVSPAHRRCGPDGCELPAKRL